jgi:hypothetical protein
MLQLAGSESGSFTAVHALSACVAIGLAKMVCGICVLQLLYDLIFEKADPTSPACSSTHRDTKNRTMLSHERNLGGQLTTNK